MTRAVFVWSKGDQLKLTEVRENTTTMIGRAPGSAVVLDDEATSTQHAKVSSREGAFFIESLSGTDATKVDNEAINERVPLSDGDVIDVGKVRLFFHDLAARRTAGLICRNCSRVSTGTARHCWFCGNRLVRIPTTRAGRAAACRIVSAGGEFYDLCRGDAFVIDREGRGKVLRSGRLPANVTALVHLKKGRPILLPLSSDTPLTLNKETPSEGAVLSTGDEMRAGKGHFVAIVR